MAFYLTFKPVSRTPFKEEMKTWTLTVHLFLKAYRKQKSMEDINVLFYGFYIIRKML